MQTATLVAFGSTRRPRATAAEDATLRHLLDAGTEAVCIVAKAWDYHVTEALRTDLDEAVRMAGESVDHLVGHGLRVFFDAEHFFDGYRANPEFSMRVLRAAEEAGAETLVLCDTNGGTLPDEVDRVLREVVPATHAAIGVHFHNDGGCGVANALAAVRLGATQVQGCVNGYGERTGNADLWRRHPQPLPEDGGAHHPRRAPRAPHPRRPPHRRAGQHRPRPQAALRRAVGVRPTRRACTRAPSLALPTPTSTWRPTRSATAPASS